MERCADKTATCFIVLMVRLCKHTRKTKRTVSINYGQYGVDMHNN